MVIRTVLKTAFVVLCIGIPASLVAGTYQESVNGGTLQYTMNYYSYNCPVGSGSPPPLKPYYQWEFGGFTYKDANGITTNLSGGGSYFNSPGGSQCPPNGPVPSSIITLTGGFGFDINFQLCAGTICPASWASVPSGYVNPKYVVTTVVYAPPGPSSYVEYGSSQETGNQISESSSTGGSSSMTESNSWSWSLNMPWSGGKLGFGEGGGTTWTQQSGQTLGSSGAFATDIKSSTNYQTFGFPITWNGFWTSRFNPHYYDDVWFWLNAVEPFNAPSGQPIMWFGYGWDACDPVNGIENYYLSVGKLNGTWQLLPGDNSVIGRGWATDPGAYAGQIPANCDGQSFPSGSGPGLSTADLNTMAGADPLTQQSYALNTNGGSTSADGRYTRMAGFVSNGVITSPAPTDIVYEQASPGSNPNAVTYNAAYTSSSSLGQSTAYSYSQTFGVDNTFSTSIWLLNLNGSLSTSNTLSYTYTTKSDITTSATDTGQFYIQSPTCTQVGGACNPVYNGPTEFNVYQDNKFGTFMFWPVN